MKCRFCHENVQGTPCQSFERAKKCPNNREHEYDDYIKSSFEENESKNQCVDDE